MAPRNWSVEQVALWFRLKGRPDLEGFVISQGITGADLMSFEKDNYSQWKSRIPLGFYIALLYGRPQIIPNS